MSTKYTGGFITKSPVAPTTSAASGIWTLDQQQQAQKAGTWPSPPIFIEDLFSTYLYTGNSSTQTITNGIDLSGQGGLVWIKNRQTTIGVPIGHILTDTVRGVTNFLRSQSTSAQETSASSITAFNSSGFSFGSDTNINYSGDTYASWTFRKQPKFFDVVTYTGDGASTKTISHNLQSVPGVIIVKRLNAISDWLYGALFTAGDYTRLKLNATNAGTLETGYGDGFSSQPTSSAFAVNSSNWNVNGGTYVAYLFAHDAGGFPVSGGGSTNGISCGSYTTDGSGNFSVNLGYEPQWIMAKRTSSTGNWTMFDNMRGLGVDGTSYVLYADLADAETGPNSFMSINSTGFGRNGGTAGQTFIYIAIRRGPMKTPTVGTSVFDISTVSTASGPVPGPTPTDMTLNKPSYDVSTNSWRANDRLRGGGLALFPNTTGVESAENYVFFDYQSGLRLSSWPVASTIWYNFKRAPSFFDEVCYTGTGSVVAQTHNLTVAPQFIITKSRSDASYWYSYHVALGATDGVSINTVDPTQSAANFWNNTSPTSTQFTTGVLTNESAKTYVAYLFATLAGISKVGSYTGTAALLTVDCGFTSGARFVLIKRTDDTGGAWYVWDSTRGITSGNDPYLILNTNAAQVTGTNYVDTDTTGFKVTAAAPAALNANGGNYIFLAIA